MTDARVIGERAIDEAVWAIARFTLGQRPAAALHSAHVRTGALRFSVALAIAGAALVGCAPGMSSESAGDYPAYGEQSLVEAAALVIEGTPVAAEAVVLPRYLLRSRLVSMPGGGSLPGSA